MSYYRDSISHFCKEEPSKIFGQLSLKLTEKFDANNETLESWSEEIQVLQEKLRRVMELTPSASDWRIILEYEIPVLGKRIDAVILAENIIYVVEYKAGSSCSGTEALEQAQDYANKIRDFHSESRNKIIIPLALGAFHGAKVDKSEAPGRGGICNPENIAEEISACFEKWRNIAANIDYERWEKRAIFAPIPSVFDAACISLSNQNVEELKHAKTDAKNLTHTQDVIIKEILDAKSRGVKKLIVLTGVPGAGKTLAGINAVVAAKRILGKDNEQSLFLSGNVPLIRVLSESLQRDAKKRGESLGPTEALINNMHRFTESQYKSKMPPAAKFIVFDEAQRAWDKKKNSKKGIELDEASMILESMTLHPDWAVLLALVGNGQEIHSGEAGLCSWGDAILNHPSWEVVASPLVIPTSTESTEQPGRIPNMTLFKGPVPREIQLTTHSALHLGDPHRSYEFELSSKWVELVLDGKMESAAQLAMSCKDEAYNDFPVYISRDLNRCKAWLRDNYISQNRRAGLIASSGAIRLRADGVEPPTKDFINAFQKYERWFLDSHRDQLEGDVLIKAGSHYSSNRLEVALSEFEMQGLEIDVACLLWGGDLIYRDKQWVPMTFSDTNSIWKPIKEPKAGEDGGNNLRIRKLNKYRVLLTRYRYRMIIYVPFGRIDDSSVNASDFDSTYNFLLGAGAKPI